MSRHIATAADADAALEYFNAFHDGFIRRLTLRSHDRFEARGAQRMSGRLDLAVLFAHYNYRNGEPPADQLVRARFHQVRDLLLDLPQRHGEWSIDRVEIGSATRAAPAGEEACLLLRLMQHHLVDGAWTTREALRFSFLDAALDEVVR